MVVEFQIEETPMAITNRPELEAQLQARAVSAGITVEVYIERIALDDLDAETELESAAIEGLSSGDSVEANEQFWSERRRQVLDRHSSAAQK